MKTMRSQILTLAAFGLTACQANPSGVHTGDPSRTAAISTGVVINEVVAKATSGAKDWLELFNASGDPIDISGWMIRDGDGSGQPNLTHLFTFPPGTLLEAGHYLVLEEGAPGSLTFGFGSTDGAYLYDNMGVLRDETKWNDGQAPEGSSWARWTNGLGPFGSLTDVTRGEQNAPNNPLADPTDYIYDEREIRDYELILDPADWEWLQANATLEEYVPGYVQFEGQTYGPAGIRFKGSYGSLFSCFDADGNQICEKLPMKVDFAELDESGRFFDVKKLQFHAMNNDPSMMHDRLGYKLFEEMGVIGPRAVYSRLWVNGEFQGAFALVEQIDGRFSRNRYSDGGEGNIYKEVWPQYTDPQPYLDALETNADEDPSVQNMVDFASAIQVSTPDTFYSTFENFMDVPATMNYLAVDRAINNWDGIMGWYCAYRWCSNHNFYWYEEVGTGKLWLIPWDMDYALGTDPMFNKWYRKPPACLTYGKSFGLRHPACDPLIGYWGSVTWQQYKAAAQSLLDGPFTAVALDAKLDLYESQAAQLVEEDPYGPTTEEWQAAAADLRMDLESMRQRLISELASH